MGYPVRHSRQSAIFAALCAGAVALFTSTSDAQTAATPPAVVQKGGSAGPMQASASDAKGQPGHMSGQNGSKAMHMKMMQGMKDMESMPMTGDTDHDFVSMMRMHHQQAIDMAQEEVRQGKDAQAKAFARKIIADQSKEIKQLDSWLAKHKR